MALDNTRRTLDPKQIIIAFGAIPITGFPDGDFISIVPDGPSFEVVKGADGSVDRANKNPIYTVTITIKQTSISNDLLSAHNALDVATNIGAVPLTVKDLNGTSLFFAPQAWIEKVPDAATGNTINTREWIFRTGADSVNFIGGNFV